MTSKATDPVVIHPVFHGSIVLETPGHVIYVDPYNGAQGFAKYPAPDLVLITDIHPDHLDTNTLAGLDLKKAKFIVPQAVMDQLPERYREQAQVIGNGMHTDLPGLGIDAVPMYNLPGPHEQFHVKGRGNGYVLTAGGERIYISGDTEDIPEMRALKDIDIAFVCMNQPFTMTVDQAADAVLAFKPKVVYPYHYRDQGGALSDVARFKQLVNAKDAHITVRQEDWYR